MTQPDITLVERLLRGDARAFDAFFSEYYPKLYRFAARRLRGDPATAEDIAQATLCRALESLHSYRGEAALLTWLCTLCRREMSARWRDNEAYSQSAPLAEDDPEIRSALEVLLATDQHDPLIATTREQMQMSILTALDYLPPPYADILEWKYVRDMSVDDIAARLGRTAKATESLLTRARAAFRETFSLLQGGSIDSVLG
jgi:RNA polymerase sigma-70 factor (ECF subfamily)